MTLNLNASSSALILSCLFACTPPSAPPTPQVLGRTLLPAVALIASSPPVDLELWELLRLLPYTTRYRLYAEQRVRAM